VARAVAPIVLDDDFHLLTITLAEGRRLFANLRKSIAYYIGAKLALVVIFVLATSMKGFPLSAIQVSKEEEEGGWWWWWYR